MRQNDRQLGIPETIYTAEKAQVEALANPVEGQIAYAADTHLLGYYNGTAWVWGTASSGTNTGDVTLSDVPTQNVFGLTGQALSIDTQAANKIFAGPTTGIAAVPTFRALVATDIPALGYEAGGAVSTHAALTTGVHGLSITAGKTLTVTDNASVTGANTGDNAGVTSVSGTSPIVSSGGNTPAISMGAATAIVNGYMTSTYASKLDGIASGANVGVVPNAAIAGASKTKITYDAKGLITSGADATTGDIADSTNKRYVTDAQLTVIGNTSGSNSGDNSANTSSIAKSILTTQGDIVVAGVAAAPERLGIGSNTYTLTSNGTTAVWAAPSGGGHTIQDEGTPLIARANLNFVGPIVTVTDDNANNATTVTIEQGTIDTENLTAQVPGAGGHYDTTYPITTNTLRVYVNGVREPSSIITSIDGDGLGFTISETLVSGDTLIVDYNESGTNNAVAPSIDILMTQVFM